MSNKYYRKTSSGLQVEYTPYYDDKGKFSLYFNSTNGTLRVGFDDEDNMQDFVQKVAPDAKQSWRNNGFDLVLLEPNTKVINLPEIEVFGDTSKLNNTLKQPEQTLKVYLSDPIIQSIFNGFYNGHKFTPTELNIRHYLDMYKNDKHVNEEYSQQKWGNVFGSHAALGTAIATAPFVPWGKALPWAAKNVVTPMVLGEGYKWLENKLTGQNLSTNISNYLQNEKGWNPFAALFVGDLTNPGYWINFAGQGKWTKPFFDKIGWNAFGKTLELLAADRLAATPAVQSATQLLMPKSKFLSYVIEPATKLVDLNLYKLQKISNPFIRGNIYAINLDILPLAKFSKDYKSFRSSIDMLNGQGIRLRNEFPLFAGSEKYYEDLLNLKVPDINFKAYNYIPSAALSNILSGAAATDLALNGDHRNPYILALEYGIVGKGALDNLIKNRMIYNITKANKYYNSYNLAFYRTQYKINDLMSRVRRYLWKNETPLHPGVKKPGGRVLDLRKIPFDNLINFLTKRYKDKIKVVGDLIYFDGELMAKRGADGKTIIDANSLFKDLLSRSTDVYDFSTGQRHTGVILVTDDGLVIFPENYIETLNNNIQHVKDKYFNGIDVRLYGSSGPVTLAGFPHSTHDIDFYVTLSGADELVKRGVIPTSRMDVAQFNIPGVPLGGTIDVNIILADANGFATGRRAEELFKQYFPDEYYEALLESLTSNTPLKISRTPEELMEKIDPSVKSIMDSFDVDFRLFRKEKHKPRAVQHILYSDPYKTSEAINQYAKSMIGENAKLFPMGEEQLSDFRTNMKAIQKIFPDLNQEEAQLIARNPQRMKNLLDAWYLLDNTPMRYINGTWPGIPGYSVLGARNSAGIWIPETNGGNANGQGLNTTILGDSNFFSPINVKAFISPRLEYKSNNLLDMIDEIIDVFGGNTEARGILRDISRNDGITAEAELQKIYDTKGWNFLQNGSKYGLGKYASGTRRFSRSAGDNIGYARSDTYMHSLSDRIPKDAWLAKPDKFKRRKQTPEDFLFNSELYFSPIKRITDIGPIDDNYISKGTKRIFSYYPNKSYNGILFGLGAGAGFLVDRGEKFYGLSQSFYEAFDKVSRMKLTAEDDKLYNDLVNDPKYYELPYEELIEILNGIIERNTPKNKPTNN